MARKRGWPRTSYCEEIPPAKEGLGGIFYGRTDDVIRHEQNAMPASAWMASPMSVPVNASFLPVHYYCTAISPNYCHADGTHLGCDHRRGHSGNHLDYSGPVGIAWAMPKPVVAPDWVQAAVMGAMLGM